MKKRIVLRRGVIDQTEVVILDCDARDDVLEVILLLASVQYSEALGKWCISQADFDLHTCFTTLRAVAYVDYREISKTVEAHQEAKSQALRTSDTTSGEDIALKPALDQFREHLLFKRYSPRTIKTYTGALRSFLVWVYPKPYSALSNEDVVAYVTRYLIPKEYGFSFQNQVINAVKLFFREVLHSEIQTEKLQRPRGEYKLPNVLSKTEVSALLQAHGNLKHRAMLSLIYACGLRRGELLNLKPRDIESARHLLIVRCGKGRKDRVVPISDKVIGMLREYYTACKPTEWLFEGQKKGSQYSEQSLQSVLKQALAKTGIKKPVTLYWLRHSYATHLLEKWVDLRFIQELLGHASSKTTEIYTHVTETSIQKIQSPFDDL